MYPKLYILMSGIAWLALAQPAAADLTALPLEALLYGDPAGDEHTQSSITQESRRIEARLTRRY